MPQRVHQRPNRKRAALSRERVLEGAVAIADADGIAGLTIRSLAQHLGAKPMLGLLLRRRQEHEILDALGRDIVFAEDRATRPRGVHGSLQWVERAVSARACCGAADRPSNMAGPGPLRYPANLRRRDTCARGCAEAGFSDEMTAAPTRCSTVTSTASRCKNVAAVRRAGQRRRR